MPRILVAVALLLLLAPAVVHAQVTVPGVDPVILGLVDTVSADTLRNYLVAMQGFFTRHTNSDTLSDSVGIGAARGWVYDRFVDISNENGGILQVEYHEFTETIQGVTRLHKNVVATLPGSDPAQADRIYILSGHLDSRNEDNMDWTGFAPGAVDDGGGGGAAIECARVLTKIGTEATVKFVNVVGEDQGLFGSSALALDAAQQGWNIEVMMTNDVFGNTVYGEVGVGDTLGVMNFPYLARNVGIDVAMIGNLANAPRPVEDFVAGNSGDSTGFQLSWSASDATDLGGYVVTVRGTDTTYWEQTIDVGNVTLHLFTPSPSESLWLGVAAYDTLGHKGLVTEELAVLSTIPFAPTGLVALPTNTTVELSWDTAPEGDFSHHNVFRALAAEGPFPQINASPVVIPAFSDTAVAPGIFYYYQVSTIDTNGSEGPNSQTARGRVASLDQGILFVDEMADGPGPPIVPPRRYRIRSTSS